MSDSEIEEYEPQLSDDDLEDVDVDVDVDVEKDIDGVQQGSQPKRQNKQTTRTTSIQLSGDEDEDDDEGDETEEEVSDGDATDEDEEGEQQSQLQEQVQTQPRTSAKSSSRNVKMNTTTQPILTENTILQEITENGIESDITDTDDEDYLRKFDEKIRNDYILQYHPEIKQSNYDEITALAKVLRDDKGNILDPFHKTIPILTKFERTRILGMRAKQINSGAEPFIKIPENIIEGYIIAEMELNAKALPYIIVRPIPGGKKEYWYLEDLEVVDY